MSSEERVLSDTVWTPERGLAQPEVRGISWDNFLLSDDKYLGKWKTDSGIRVTPETALQSTVVLASCRILAETIAGLPIRVYRKNADGSEEVAKDIPLHKILSFSPNEWQTKPEFFEQVMMYLTLWGNSYSRIRSGKYGSVSALDNLHPSRMEVERLENGRLRYSYTDPETGRLERYTQDQIMHIRWTPEPDGIKGMVPVEIAREAIGLARACEQHAARFWANAARPGVVLTTDGTLTAEAAERLRDNWERLHRGSERAFRTAVLTGGMKVTELGFTNEASQFNATRAAQTEEVARVYRLPLHLIQGASGGDLEVQGQEFVTYTLMPWINRIESSISRSLIIDDDMFVARFDVRGLLRANSQQRASYYSTMTSLGVMTINEIRRLEGLKDLGPDGDHHFVAMNMTTLEDAVKPKPEGGMPPAGGDGGPPAPAAGGPPSLPEVKTGKAPIASPKGEASKPKMEDAIEESSADWEDAVEDRAFCPNGEGNGIDNSCSSSGGSSVEAEKPSSLRVEAKPGDIESRLGTFGVEMDDALQFAGGARSDTRVFVRSDYESGDQQGVHLECTRDVAGVKDGLFSVTVVRNAGTREKPEVVVDHKVIEVTPEVQADPLKRQTAARDFMRTMTQSVTAAAGSGVSKVVLNAAGHSSKGTSQTFRGYTIWPRMGFDAPIPYHLRSQLPPTLASSRTLLDLHKTPEGTRWWRDNGVSVDVQLDLTKLDSPQMQVFNRFVKHFKRDRRDIEMFEGEDWLSPADQKKINEIWGTIWAEGILDGYKESDQDFSKIEKRAFCPNGTGGGVTNTCGGDQFVAANDERLKERVPFVPSTGTRNGDFAVPPSEEEFTKALTGSNKSKGTKIGEAKNIEDGTPVALRIDIPAFNWSRENLGKSIYAVTVHENKGGKSFGAPIAYEPIARLSGPVTFASKENDAIKVATGESSKFPLATVKGSFDKSRDVPADIDSWTPVGYDPKKAAYFYDKRTGREVTGGTDAVSVGNTVFVRMPEYGDRHAQHQYRHLADSWGLESRALSAANQELYKAQEDIAEENGKWPQSEAHYMEKNPFASRGMKCSNCLYYEDGQCEIVTGSVSPEGICKLWIIPEEKLSNPEQRAFCPNGEGGGVTNSCGSGGRDGSGVDSSQSSPWDSEPGEREWTREDLRESAPISGGSDLRNFYINDTEALASVASDIGATLDEVVEMGGGTRNGGTISIDADDGGVTVSSELPVSPSGTSRDGIVAIETTIFPTDEGAVIAYDNLSVEGVSRTKPGLVPRVSSLMLQRMTESMSRAEALGFLQAETDAVGDATSTLKGYRLWPQFGFDGDVPTTVAKTASEYEFLPEDIRAKAASGTLKVQELIATREGERFWDEFGSSIGLTFDFRNKGSLGYARFEKMKSLVSQLRDRNSSRSYLENIVSRAFCPTGEGGGINNSCGGDGHGSSSPSGEKSGSDCPSPCHTTDVTADKNKDGVTDAARVGVPAMDVPPPPGIPRVPNLGDHERKVEESFLSHFENDPDGVASQFRQLVVKQGDPPTFGTDDAKVLTDAWSDPDPDTRAHNRATLNVALHQTANAVAKRAFVQHLDTLKEGDEIMVTVGGCGAGKGFALKSVPQALELKKAAKAVWDSAGDQNATENPWIQKEAEARGLKVTYVYVHADPHTQWADPERGVVKRASDPKDGRMVDAKVFADSYAIGAKNHDAFHEANKDNPSARFVFLDNTGKPKLIDGVPKEALSLDADKLAEFAEKKVEESSAPERVKAGGLVGRKIWPNKKAKNG